MKPRAVLKHHSNSYPFEERDLDLTGLVKVGRAVAKCKPQGDNAIFDCKVLSRNHAVMWFEEGKFFIRDTCSSNGTFINNNRLSPANEDSPPKEIRSNDIIQLGVEVIDNASKITHNCIILRVKLLYPDGSEAPPMGAMLNIPTPNMLPPYYSYTQMLEREQQIYYKLSLIEKVLDEAHLLADININAKKEKEALAKQLEEFKVYCDEKTKQAEKLEHELSSTKDKTSELQANHDEDSRLIRSLEAIAKDRDCQIENLQNQLDCLIRQDHRLMTTLFLLLIIVLVVGGFDMIAMFGRLMNY